MPSTAQANQRLILLEFDEFCPQLIDLFIDEGALPNFKRWITSGQRSRFSPKGHVGSPPRTDVRSELEQALAFQA